jgi:hypothetical protein
LDAWLSGSLDFNIVGLTSGLMALYYAKFSGFMHQRPKDQHFNKIKGGAA